MIYGNKNRNFFIFLLLFFIFIENWYFILHLFAPLFISERKCVHLCHETISAGAFFILKNDICVVIGYQISKPRIISRHSSLAESTRRQGVLADIWYMLFEDQRGKLSQIRPSAGTSAGSARQGKATVIEYGQPQAKDQQENLEERGACAYATPNGTVVGCLEAAATMMMVHHNRVPLPRGRPCAVTALVVSRTAGRTTMMTTTTTATTMLRATIRLTFFFSASCHWPHSRLTITRASHTPRARTLTTDVIPVVAL